MLAFVDQPDQYLEHSEYVDWQEPAVLEAAKSLAGPGDEAATAKNVFYFVRDEIAHSWDAQDRRVTAKASEVLREKVGICWAKANLLAALMRANGIPAGICYQRLTLGDTPDTGYCIHALNAVYLKSVGRWVRLDARGNKPGVCAQFSTEEERLAFPVRAEFGEADYRTVYARPHPKTIETLLANVDALEMYRGHLPEEL